METLQNILTAHPFFTDFPQRYLELVAGCASNVRFAPGEFILHEGEDAGKFYLIREGSVELTIGSERRGQLSIVTLKGGDILGWSWLFPPYRWRFSARAVEPTRAFAMDGLCLREKAEHDHDLGYELLRRFARVSENRLDTMRQQLVKVYEHT
ncbi:MAG: cyclic nucleotide-binding domain-containing protein [Terriglobia bacterium]|jgi:CRP-like cAMP-binding protein